VEFAGFVDDERLRALYRAAKVYCQPSLHEAFACSVAEAMLFNALPVVSDRGSLPEVAGPGGVFVPACDPNALAAALREALGRESYGPVSPRAHIRCTFPAARRTAALDEILERLT
jgi:glycosyltransferase involved in cell wall biosynthesis